MGFNSEFKGLNSNKATERIHNDGSFPHVPRVILFPHQTYVFISAFRSLVTLFRWKLKGVSFVRAERFGIVDKLLDLEGKRMEKIEHRLFRHPCEFFYVSKHARE